jgi:hypothetical protein
MADIEGGHAWCGDVLRRQYCGWWESDYWVSCAISFGYLIRVDFYQFLYHWTHYSEFGCFGVYSAFALVISWLSFLGIVMTSYKALASDNCHLHCYAHLTTVFSLVQSVCYIVPLLFWSENHCESNSPPYYKNVILLLLLNLGKTLASCHVERCTATTVNPAAGLNHHDYSPIPDQSTPHPPNYPNSSINT